MAAVVIPDESEIRIRSINNGDAGDFTTKLKIVAATVQLDAQLQDVTGLGDETLIMQLGGMVIAKGQLVCVTALNDWHTKLDVFKGQLTLATDDGGSIKSEGQRYVHETDNPDDVHDGSPQPASPSGHCWFTQKQVSYHFGSHAKRALIPIVLNFVMGNPLITE